MGQTASDSSGATVNWLSMETLSFHFIMLSTHRDDTGPAVVIYRKIGRMTITASTLRSPLCILFSSFSFQLRSIWRHTEVLVLSWVSTFVRDCTLTNILGTGPLIFHYHIRLSRYPLVRWISSNCIPTLIIATGSDTVSGILQNNPLRNTSLLVNWPLHSSILSVFLSTDTCRCWATQRKWSLCFIPLRTRWDNATVRRCYLVHIDSVFYYSRT